MMRVLDNVSSGVNNLAEDQRQLLSYYSSLDEDGQRCLLGMAGSIAKGHAERSQRVARPQLRVVGGRAA